MTGEEYVIFKKLLNKFGLLTDWRAGDIKVTHLGDTKFELTVTPENEKLDNSKVSKYDMEDRLT